MKPKKGKGLWVLVSFCSLLIYISSCGGYKMLTDILATSYLHGSRGVLSL